MPRLSAKLMLDLPQMAFVRLKDYPSQTPSMISNPRIVSVRMDAISRPPERSTTRDHYLHA